MSYNASVAELREYLAVPLEECPAGEESTWVWYLDNYALEARMRLACGHYSGPEADMRDLALGLDQRAREMEALFRQRDPSWYAEWRAI